MVTVHLLVDLIESAAVLAIGPVLIAPAKIGKTVTVSWTVQAGIGLAFGLVGLIAMAAPITIRPGVPFDGHDVALILAAPAGGVLSGVLTAAILAVMRYWQGGPNLLPGLCSLGLLCATACAYHAALVAAHRDLRRRDLLLLGVLAAAGPVVIRLSSEVLDMATLLTISLWGLANFLGVQLVGLLIIWDRNRRATHLALAERERLLRERTEELRTARIEADAANLAKSSFLSLVTHELRSPLTAIRGFAELAAARYHGVLDAKGLSYLSSIVASASHMTDLVDDLLDTSRAETGNFDLHPEEVDLGALLRETVDMMRVRAAMGEISLDVPFAADVRMWGDRRRLKQILVNLLTNAIKYTPSHGTVTATLSGEGDSCEIIISDTGIGIAAEDLPRALRPFGRIDNEVNRQDKGVGLGLPLTKHLVELHSGSLTISSAPGKGTSVVIALPCCAAAPAV